MYTEKPFGENSNTVQGDVNSLSATACLQYRIIYHISLQNKAFNRCKQSKDYFQLILFGFLLQYTYKLKG